MYTMVDPGIVDPTGPNFTFGGVGTLPRINPVTNQWGLRFVNPVVASVHTYTAPVSPFVGRAGQAVTTPGTRSVSPISQIANGATTGNGPAWMTAGGGGSGGSSGGGTAQPSGLASLIALHPFFLLACGFTVLWLIRKA